VKCLPVYIDGQSPTRSVEGRSGSVASDLCPHALKLMSRLVGPLPFLVCLQVQDTKAINETNKRAHLLLEATRSCFPHVAYLLKAKGWDRKSQVPEGEYEQCTSQAKVTLQTTCKTLYERVREAHKEARRQEANQAAVCIEGPY
jgi:hypothetical protein